MNYDAITGLPTIESFIEFATKMWSSNPIDRFSILCIYFDHLHSYEPDTKISNDILIVQRLIRSHHDYMLSACKYENGIYMVLVDKSSIITDDLALMISNDLEIFYKNVINSSNSYLIHAGLCNLDSHINDVNEAMSYSLLALNSLEANERSLCKVSWYSSRTSITKVVSKNNELKIIPIFEDLMSSNQLLLYLQPKFEIDNEVPIGAEALVRLLDSNSTLLKPRDFLSILENHNLSYKLDLMVMEKMLKQIQLWITDGYTPIPISINLSAFDFVNEEFGKIFYELLEKYENEIKYIEFEISEEAYMENPEYISEKITKLHHLGFKVSMDGFGKNGIIQKDEFLPLVDSIKLNKNLFILGRSDSNNTFMIKKFVKDCKAKNITVMVEGIENINFENNALQCGISIVQGFFYDKPLPIDIFTRKYMDYVSKRNRA